MKEKLYYTVPATEVVEVRIQQNLLDGSVSTVGVNKVQGWTSSEEEW